jgi:hypothetical protein
MNKKHLKTRSFKELEHLDCPDTKAYIKILEKHRDSTLQGLRRRNRYMDRAISSLENNFEHMKIIEEKNALLLNEQNAMLFEQKSGICLNCPLRDHGIEARFGKKLIKYG